MELAAYIYDAWAFEKAHQENPDTDLLAFNKIDKTQCQQDRLVWNLTAMRWRSYLLSAIAITGLNGFSLAFNNPVEASYPLEPSVNTPPWCENLYLCKTGYILEVQTLLTERGFDAGSLDGVYGRYTKQAVIDFQKSQTNLVVDGIPGANTLALLRNAAQNSSIIQSSDSKINQVVIKASTANKPSNVQIIVRSTNVQRIEGSEVGNLQILLKQRGFYEGEIDGQLGKSTTTAISKAQQAYLLPLDGFAGPLTMRALLAGGTNVPLSLPALARSPMDTDVIEVQQMLKERGFYDSEINGRFNLQTRESIFKAQSAYGQKATGDLSPELIATLKGQGLDQSTTQDIQNIPTDAKNPPKIKSQAPSSGQNAPTQPNTQPNTNSS